MTDDASCFQDSLARGAIETEPFRHLLLDNALSEQTRLGVLELPIDVPSISAFPGQREGNNQTRVFFDPANCRRFPVCQNLVDTFRDAQTLSALEAACGIRLRGSSLRIEYCQDRDGFWLEPHRDIDVKLCTILVYLSHHREDLGTDIYDAGLEWVKRAPYGPNLGLIFVPGEDTWHGFERRSIRGTRQSLIINYVSSEWRSRHELAGLV